MKYKTLRSSAVQGAFVLEAHLWALSRAGQGRSVQRGLRCSRHCSTTGNSRTCQLLAVASSWTGG